MNIREVMVEAELDQPPEAVWVFLTACEDWGRWWAEGDALLDVDPRWEEGGRLTFASGWSAALEGFVPPSRMAFGPYVLELTGAGEGGTRLRLAHRRQGMALDDLFDPIQALGGTSMDEEVDAGMRLELGAALSRLSEALATPKSERVETDARSTWVLREASASERWELVDAGRVGPGNLSEFKVYRVVAARDEALGDGDILSVPGLLTCATCGKKTSQRVVIGFEGFMRAGSQHLAVCPNCEGAVRITGVTTEGRDGEAARWLLVRMETGPPGKGPLPGTDDQLPHFDAEAVC